MAKLTIKINGFTYVVACEDGQESHLLAMAEQVENRVTSIKALGGQSGEARLLVLAALLMADELHDTEIEMKNLRAARPPAPQPASFPAPEIDPKLAERIAKLAAHAEEIAARIEQA